MPKNCAICHEESGGFCYFWGAPTIWIGRKCRMFSWKTEKDLTFKVYKTIPENVEEVRND